MMRLIGQYFIPYANVIGLNTSWNFFSPDPAHVMYFQYSITKKDQDPNEESTNLYIPEQKNYGPFGLVDRRVMYAMRFMILDQRRVDALLGPWLCKKHPEALMIHVEHKIESIPPIDSVAFNPDGENSRNDKQIKMVDKDFNCNSLDEISL